MKNLKFIYIILLVSIIFSCKNQEEKNNFPLRYIIDIRGEKDSLIYSEDLESGSYNIVRNRFVFYVEDGKDSVFYSSSLNFESYQALPIEVTLKNEIISVTTNLINPSNFNSNLEKGEKTVHLFIQSVNSNNKMIHENSNIGAHFHYQKHLSEISQQLEQIFKRVQDVVKG